MTPDETPENEPTEAEVPAADAPDDVAAATPAEPGASKRGAREERARREHAAKSARPSRTPEQRDADRRERRRKKAVARRRRREQEKVKRATTEKRRGTPPPEPRVSTPQVRTGTVVSARADKTITVRIDVARRHRRYQKIVRSTSKLHAHDAANDASEGDLVRVVESRPLSATKRWKLVEVLERAK